MPRPKVSRAAASGRPVARAATRGRRSPDAGPGRGPAERAIGVFDSGVGGLTVLKALAARMPRETLLYLGDTARVPYGSKSADTVTGYAVETGDFFAERDVKLMVVACNTTSAIALDVLRSRYPVPVVGVIEPGARAAIRATRKGRIGVIGTEATIGSGAYARALRDLEPGVEIFTRACPLFVPLAEEGWTDNEVARRTVSLYLSSLKRSGIDTLILGCTHYPLLRAAIAGYMGPEVTIVDSAEETASEVRRTLRSGAALRARGEGGASFFVTDAAERFARLGERFYGASVGSAVRIVLRGEAPPRRRRARP
ncbi:MAG: glutamate racemase [Alphaproteobacteria bacterium]